MRLERYSFALGFVLSLTSVALLVDEAQDSHARTEMAWMRTCKASAARMDTVFLEIEESLSLRAGGLQVDTLQGESLSGALRLLYLGTPSARIVALVDSSGSFVGGPAFMPGALEASSIGRHAQSQEAIERFRQMIRSVLAREGLSRPAVSGIYKELPERVFAVTVPLTSSRIVVAEISLDYLNSRLRNESLSTTGAVLVFDPVRAISIVDGGATVISALPQTRLLDIEGCREGTPCMLRRSGAGRRVWSCLGASKWGIAFVEEEEIEFGKSLRLYLLALLVVMSSACVFLGLLVRKIRESP